MFEKILVCLDGSKLAEQIIPQVTEAALRFNSEVVLLSVIPPSSVLSEVEASRDMGTNKSPTITDKVEEAANFAHAYLETVAAPLRQNGLTVNCVAFEDNVDEGIVSYAKNNGIGLIAIATHGRSGLKRTTLGSVADFIIRESGLPILVIKPA